LSMLLLLSLLVRVVVQANPDEDALFNELFHTRRYNRLVRPVLNLSETIDVKFTLVLQKIDQMVCYMYSLL